MSRNLRNILLLPVFFAFAFSISSCSKDEVEIERPEKVYYDQAQRRIKVNNYFGAIESLQIAKLRQRIHLQRDLLDFIHDIQI